MDRLPPLRLLTTFDAVQRLGSMQRAAGELNVTRPAVTQAVKALEEEIGVALFDRTAKPAVPTEAGERLAAATRSGLGQISEAIEEIRFAAGLAGRNVTVSCTLGMATQWLMPRLSDFYQHSPDTMVNVQAPPSNLPAFETGVDVALRSGAGEWTDGETWKLFDEIVCPVARPDIIEGLEGDLERLSSAPLIHVRSPRAHNWASWPAYFSAMDISRPKGAQQVFDNYIQATQAALDGRGVMLGWQSITKEMIASGRLMALDGGEHDFGTAYWVTCGRNSLHKPAARAFVDWLVAAA